MQINNDPNKMKSSKLSFGNSRHFHYFLQIWRTLNMIQKWILIVLMLLKKQVRYGIKITYKQKETMSSIHKSVYVNNNNDIRRDLKENIKKYVFSYYFRLIIKFLFWFHLCTSIFSILSCRLIYILPIISFLNRVFFI